jgi:hypothetical protein
MARRVWAMAGAAALLALGGCGKQAAEGGKAVQAQGQAPAQASGPAEMPKRKAGLWEQSVHSGQMNQTTRICLDAATEAKLGIEGTPKGPNPCAQSAVTRTPGGWEFSSTCDMAEMGRMTTHGVASGDFGSSYRVDVDSTTTGAQAPEMNGEHKFSIEAKWLGPCPAGMAGGDMELANGMRINPTKAR